MVRSIFFIFEFVFNYLHSYLELELALSAIVISNFGTNKGVFHRCTRLKIQGVAHIFAKIPEGSRLSGQNCKGVPYFGFY
jgi:hypothetical protein